MIGSCGVQNDILNPATARSVAAEPRLAPFREAYISPTRPSRNNRVWGSREPTLKHARAFSCVSVGPLKPTGQRDNFNRRVVDTTRGSARPPQTATDCSQCGDEVTLDRTVAHEVHMQKHFRSTHVQPAAAPRGAHDDVHRLRMPFDARKPPRSRAVWPRLVWLGSGGEEQLDDAYIAYGGCRMTSTLLPAARSCFTTASCCRLMATWSAVFPSLSSAFTSSIDMHLSALPTRAMSPDVHASSRASEALLTSGIASCPTSRVVWEEPGEEGRPSGCM
eukprot:CAMPEP_0195653342 /NCGR_PEP_ID=MMETSP0815-20121206/33345_1 /TAXON_ID=97485 /ORGANISM="Prymnesium parvum, Strain Texoma1" /LENGTH=276 /DNA_ID=CAMNT_0040797499 /DNA_START=620 /DNA_END=1451 /DNA_ORIENTATION=+